MQYLMDIAYLMALILLSPKILYRRFAQGRYRDGWSQRLGHIRRRTDKPCLWIHAVSVGEVNATQTLIPALCSAFPDHEIVLSATTDTGMARAKSLYGNDLAVFYYPFDLSWIVRRALNRLRPDVCLLMELELWPNLARQAAKRGIPIVIVNGRISDRSFPRYKSVRSFVVPVFSRVSLILAQTRQYADRFIALGCRSDAVRVVPSLKYDTAEITDTVTGTDALARQLHVGDEPIWVAGGTGDGEEEIVLSVHKQLRDDSRFANLRLMIIPRKPERFDEVAEQIRNSGLAFERYSRIKSQNLELTEKCPV
ncbi:MAG: 3-deoxy-D-manno-octulosonic acid transferase, partial [Phycisphaerae bacterium]|nr:3-deoxy-D-manno-octulosonic acid transferase [Phycisphaerae bacterium]